MNEIWIEELQQFFLNSLNSPVESHFELSLSSSDYDNKLTHLDCDGDQPFFFPLFKSFLATYLVYCWFKLNHM
jgi:hypothetical protein